MIDSTVKGLALESFGFTAENTISGLGLNSFGFLWGCPDIWTMTDEALTTTWISVPGYNDNVETCVE